MSCGDRHSSGLANNKKRELRMKKAFALIAAATMAGAVGAAESNLDQLSLEELEVQYQSIQQQVASKAAGVAAKVAAAKNLPESCLTFPLPTEPTGPMWTTRYTRSDGAATDMTFWRIACNPSESVVMVTLNPVGDDGPFLCGTTTSFSVLQNGVQATGVGIVHDDQGYQAICGNLYAPVTGWLNVTMAPGFDPNGAFTVQSSGFERRFQMPAYDPTQYDLTPPELRLTHEFSGSWYNREGKVVNQGWFLEFNWDSKIALAAWFTGNEDATELMWYTAQGRIEGNVAKMDLYRTKYVTFGGTTGVTQKVGWIDMTFTSCDEGIAEWQFNGKARESLKINRMIAAPSDCQARSMGQGQK